jgi:hypothetical protein
MVFILIFFPKKPKGAENINSGLATTIMLGPRKATISYKTRWIIHIFLPKFSNCLNIARSVVVSSKNE